MAESKSTKEPRIGGRLPPDLRETLDSIHELYGSSDSIILTELIEAWCAHVLEEGGVRWPVVIKVDEKKHAEKLQLLAESQARYGKKR